VLKAKASLPPQCHFGSSQATGRRGFTLLEILLVLLVISIAAFAVIPTVVESMNGSSVRQAMRDMVSLHHYARSRAILDQRPMLILYDQDTQVLELLQLPPRVQTSTADWLEPPMQPSDPLTLPGDEEAGAIVPILKRPLPKSVQLIEVEDLPQENNVWFAVYAPSGMCDPHRVRFQDQQERIHEVFVQGFTGDVRIGDEP